jgi:hypothetical protein
MLEELPRDDDVEARLVERERLVQVGPPGLDPSLAASASASRSASTPTTSFPSAYRLVSAPSRQPRSRTFRPGPPT